MSRAGPLPVTRRTRAGAAALGVTRRQLEYWVEMGWIRSADPPSRGHPRTFTATEKKVLALMARLTAAGIPARVAAGPAREAVAEAAVRGTGTASVALASGLVLTVRYI